jgi:hypothetical protein
MEANFGLIISYMKLLIWACRRARTWLYYEVYVPFFWPDMHLAIQMMTETLLRDIGWADRSEREAANRERRKEVTEDA